MMLRVPKIKIHYLSKQLRRYISPLAKPESTPPKIISRHKVSFFKGIEQVSTSLTFPIVNTLGFNGTNNTRFVHSTDGVETHVPVLTLPVGMLTNTADIDVESVELIPGPASALYGPNAFNGIMSIQTKDPFRFPGLSASLRVGVNQVDRVDTTPRPLYDISLRYGWVFRERLGSKVCLSGLSAHDWIASGNADQRIYAGTSGAYAVPGPQNPGYNGVNLYGDEARSSPAAVRTLAMNQGLQLTGLFPQDTNDLGFYLARTGYWEKDVVQYQAQTVRGTLGLYYRLSDKLQLSYATYISGAGSTVFQASARHMLRDFVFWVNKLELSGSRFKI